MTSIELNTKLYQVDRNKREEGLVESRFIVYNCILITKLDEYYLYQFALNSFSNVITKKAQEEVDSLRKQLNDKIKQQNADIAVKKQSIDESNQQTTTEIIKYVKESPAASDVLDDDFVRVYNESLPTD